MQTQDALPALSRATTWGDVAPPPGHADLPETILQFGTGAFLRGFVEYFVDEANRAGAWNGSVVMVSSTGSGRAVLLEEQDDLYTLCVRGVEEGDTVDRARVVAAVSRALSAQDHWSEVLAVARQSDLKLVTSNTTEVGITLDEDDQIDLAPPRSFPGKLTAVLYERARAFGYAPEAGLVILPCELIENNGETLRDIVLTLARRWELGEPFETWVRDANSFCNTLVDRIVPGTPEGDDLADLYRRIGYRDDLLTVAEPYRLWAIEGNDSVRARVDTLSVDPGMVVTDDITPYRVRKVRILNGTHTITVPAAYLCGCETVREAIDDPLVSEFLRRVMLDEIVPSLDLDADRAQAFAQEVLDRFANPFIRHELLDITFQQTTKMRVRVLPSLLDFVGKRDAVPESIAFGFACFLLFQHEDYRPADEALPTDDARAYWHGRWAGVEDLEDEEALRRFVATVAADEDRWGRDLSVVPGFLPAVENHLVRVVQQGPRAALEAHLSTVDT